MAERRRYAPQEKGWRPLYSDEEVAGLVGGTGSKTALRDLAADIRRLAALGLVTIEPHRITFARSVEQLRVEDDLASFWAFFQAIPNRRRTVPVPRRTLRALAAGFSRGVTAYVIGALIRSVFWKRTSGGGGAYTADGRMQLSWLATTFGISRRAATEARSRLLELGWLEPMPVQQWELNKWGVRDVVNVHWSPATTNDAAHVDNSDAEPVGEGSGAGKPATPAAQSAAGSASPCLNRSSSSSRRLRTRRPGAPHADRSGVCTSSTREKGRKKTPLRSSGTPSIQDIRPSDLRDPDGLQELRTQAIALGFPFDGGAGELDFFALAHRARSHGRRPEALFFDLIKNRRLAFITIADEEAARGQLRELRDGSTVRSSESSCGQLPVLGHNGGPQLDGGGGGSSDPRELTEEERTVENCIRVAKQLRMRDPFRVAQKVKGWTREQWDDAYLRYRTKQIRRWQPATAGDALDGGFAAIAVVTNNVD